MGSMAGLWQLLLTQLLPLQRHAFHVLHMLLFPMLLFLVGKSVLLVVLCIE